MNVFGLNLTKNPLQASLSGLLSACLISTLIITANHQPVMAGDYESGVSAYKQKRYDKALGYFQTDLKNNPSNAKSMFYTGMTLAKSGKLAEAREAFELVTKMLPAQDPIAQKAKRNIELMSKAQITLTSGSSKADQIAKIQSSKYKSNYISHAIPNGSVIRFDENKMPLKVYVENGYNTPGYRTEMRSAINSAFTAWRVASGGKVRFAPTSKKENADIVVSWREKFEDNKLGVSPYRFYGKTLVRSDVHLGTHMPDGSPMPIETFRATTIHEFGHAIGIKGHSPYPDDIMYFSINGQQSNSLTSRDKNTINWLYKVQADVTNSADMSVAQTKSYFEYMKKGQEAMQSGNDQHAITYFQKAASMSNSQPEAKYSLGYLIFNRGIKRWKQQDLRNARNDFAYSEKLMADVLRSKNPPKGAQENLKSARYNREMLDKHLNQ